jgi:hypothetical protein
MRTGKLVTSLEWGGGMGSTQPVVVGIMGRGRRERRRERAWGGVGEADRR